MCSYGIHWTLHVLLVFLLPLKSHLLLHVSCTKHVLLLTSFCWVALLVSSPIPIYIHATGNIAHFFTAKTVKTKRMSLQLPWLPPMSSCYNYLRAAVCFALSHVLSRCNFEEVVNQVNMHFPWSFEILSFFSFLACGQSTEKLHYEE